MPTLFFTPNLQRHLECPPMTVDGATVHDVLEAYFVHHPRARGYILDEQGALRKHMVIFIDNAPISDREHLSDAVPANGEVFVMQALSGGALTSCDR